MKVKLDKGAYAPTRAHLTDAGLDIRAKNDSVVRARQSQVFRTGVHVQLPHYHCGLLVIVTRGLMAFGDIAAKIGGK